MNTEFLVYTGFCCDKAPMTAAMLGHNKMDTYISKLLLSILCTRNSITQSITVLVHIIR